MENVCVAHCHLMGLMMADGSRKDGPRSSPGAVSLAFCVPLAVPTAIDPRRQLLNKLYLWQPALFNQMRGFTIQSDGSIR